MSSKQLFISQLGAATRTVNAEIKKQIIEVGAVDTGRMKNVTKVKVGYKGTIYIKAREITDKTLERPKVQAALDKLFDKWMDYMIDRQFE